MESKDVTPTALSEDEQSIDENILPKNPIRILPRRKHYSVMFSLDNSNSSRENTLVESFEERTSGMNRQRRIAMCNVTSKKKYSMKVNLDETNLSTEQLFPYENFKFGDNSDIADMITNKKQPELIEMRNSANVTDLKHNKTLNNDNLNITNLSAISESGFSPQIHPNLGPSSDKKYSIGIELDSVADFSHSSQEMLCNSEGEHTAERYGKTDDGIRNYEDCIEGTETPEENDIPHESNRCGDLLKVISSNEQDDNIGTLSKTQCMVGTDFNSQDEQTVEIREKNNIAKMHTPQKDIDHNKIPNGVTTIISSNEQKNNDEVIAPLKATIMFVKDNISVTNLSEMSGEMCSQKHPKLGALCKKKYSVGVELDSTIESLSGAEFTHSSQEMLCGNITKLPEKQETIETNLTSHIVDKFGEKKDKSKCDIIYNSECTEMCKISDQNCENIDTTDKEKQNEIYIKEMSNVENVCLNKDMDTSCLRNDLQPSFVRKVEQTTSNVTPNKSDVELNNICVHLNQHTTKEFSLDGQLAESNTLNEPVVNDLQSECEIRNNSECSEMCKISDQNCENIDTTDREKQNEIYIKEVSNVENVCLNKDMDISCLRNELQPSFVRKVEQTTSNVTPSKSNVELNNICVHLNQQPTKEFSLDGPLAESNTLNEPVVNDLQSECEIRNNSECSEMCKIDQNCEKIDDSNMKKQTEKYTKEVSKIENVFTNKDVDSSYLRNDLPSSVKNVEQETSDITPNKSDVEINDICVQLSQHPIKESSGDSQLTKSSTFNVNDSDVNDLKCIVSNQSVIKPSDIREKSMCEQSSTNLADIINVKSVNNIQLHNSPEPICLNLDISDCSIQSPKSVSVHCKNDKQVEIGEPLKCVPKCNASGPISTNGSTNEGSNLCNLHEKHEKDLSLVTTKSTNNINKAGGGNKLRRSAEVSLREKSYSSSKSENVCNEQIDNKNETDNENSNIGKAKNVENVSISQLNDVQPDRTNLLNVLSHKTPFSQATDDSSSQKKKNSSSNNLLVIPSTNSSANEPEDSVPCENEIIPQDRGDSQLNKHPEMENIGNSEPQNDKILGNIVSTDVTSTVVLEDEPSIDESILPKNPIRSLPGRKHYSVTFNLNNSDSSRDNTLDDSFKERPSGMNMLKRNVICNMTVKKKYSMKVNLDETDLSTEELLLYENCKFGGNTDIAEMITNEKQPNLRETRNPEKVSVLKTFNKTVNNGNLTNTNLSVISEGGVSQQILPNLGPSSDKKYSIGIELDSVADSSHSSQEMLCGNITKLPEKRGGIETNLTFHSDNMVDRFVEKKDNKLKCDIIYNSECTEMCKVSDQNCENIDDSNMKIQTEKYTKEVTKMENVFTNKDVDSSLKNDLLPSSVKKVEQKTSNMTPNKSDVELNNICVQLNQHPIKESSVDSQLTTSSTFNVNGPDVNDLQCIVSNQSVIKPSDKCEKSMCDQRSTNLADINVKSVDNIQLLDSPEPICLNPEISYCSIQFPKSVSVKCKNDKQVEIDEPLKCNVSGSFSTISSTNEGNNSNNLHEKDPLDVIAKNTNNTDKDGNKLKSVRISFREKSYSASKSENVCNEQIYNKNETNKENGNVGVDKNVENDAVSQQKDVEPDTTNSLNILYHKIPFSETTEDLSYQKKKNSSINNSLVIPRTNSSVSEPKDPVPFENVISQDKCDPQSNKLKHSEMESIHNQQTQNDKMLGDIASTNVTSTVVLEDGPSIDESILPKNPIRSLPGRKHYSVMFNLNNSDSSRETTLVESFKESTSGMNKQRRNAMCNMTLKKKYSMNVNLDGTDLPTEKLLPYEIVNTDIAKMITDQKQPKLTEMRDSADFTELKTFDKTANNEKNITNLSAILESGFSPQVHPNLGPSSDKKYSIGIELDSVADFSHSCQEMLCNSEGEHTAEKFGKTDNGIRNHEDCIEGTETPEENDISHESNRCGDLLKVISSNEQDDNIGTLSKTQCLIGTDFNSQDEQTVEIREKNNIEKVHTPQKDIDHNKISNGVTTVISSSEQENNDEVIAPLNATTMVVKDNISVTNLSEISNEMCSQKHPKLGALCKKKYSVGMGLDSTIESLSGAEFTHSSQEMLCGNITKLPEKQETIETNLTSHMVNKFGEKKDKSKCDIIYNSECTEMCKISDQNCENIDTTDKEKQNEIYIKEMSNVENVCLNKDMDTSCLRNDLQPSFVRKVEQTTSNVTPNKSDVELNNICVHLNQHPTKEFSLDGQLAESNTLNEPVVNGLQSECEIRNNSECTETCKISDQNLEKVDDSNMKKQTEKYTKEVSKIENVFTNKDVDSSYLRNDLPSSVKNVEQETSDITPNKSDVELNNICVQLNQHPIKKSSVDSQLPKSSTLNVNDLQCIVPTQSVIKPLDISEKSMCDQSSTNLTDIRNVKSVDNIQLHDSPEPICLNLEVSDSTIQSPKSVSVKFKNDKQVEIDEPLKCVPEFNVSGSFSTNDSTNEGSKSYILHEKDSLDVITKSSNNTDKDGGNKLRRSVRISLREKSYTASKSENVCNEKTDNKNETSQKKSNIGKDKNEENDAVSQMEDVPSDTNFSLNVLSHKTPFSQATDDSSYQKKKNSSSNNSLVIPRTNSSANEQEDPVPCENEIISQDRGDSQLNKLKHSEMESIGNSKSQNDKENSIHASNISHNCFPKPKLSARMALRNLVENKKKRKVTFRASKLNSVIDCNSVSVERSDLSQSGQSLENSNIITELLLHKKQQNAGISNKTIDDLSCYTSLEVSSITQENSKQRRKLIYHSTPIHKIPMKSKSFPKISLQPRIIEDDESIFNEDPDPIMNDITNNYLPNTNQCELLEIVTAHKSKSVSSPDIGDNSSVHLKKRRKSSTSKQLFPEVESKGNLSASNVSHIQLSHSYSQSSFQESQLTTHASVGENHNDINTFLDSEIDINPHESSIVIFKDKHIQNLKLTTKRRRQEDSIFIPRQAKKRKTSEYKSLTRLPKLYKPIYWINNKLYEYLYEKLYPKYKLETRKVSEEYTILLFHVYTSVTHGYLEPALSTLKNKVIELGLCETQLDFITFMMRTVPLNFYKLILPMGGAFGCPITPKVTPFEKLQ